MSTATGFHCRKGHKMRFVKRVFVYILGLVIMAFGIVLIKKAELGMSPISTIAGATSNITTMTLGTVTILFQALCVVLLILVERRVRFMTVLLLPLSVGFGCAIDFFLTLLQLPEIHLVLRSMLCLAGIVLTALGIVIIASTDFMLPAPDAFVRSYSRRFAKPLGRVKMAGDITWVAVAATIEMLSMRQIVSVGIGTIAAMILTGRFIDLFTRWASHFRFCPSEQPTIR